MSNTKIDSKYKTMFSDYPDVVTVAQLRKMLGISRHLAYELICEKKIKAFQLGNSYKIPKVNVIEYIIQSQENLEQSLATVYKGNIIKNLIMDCQSYTKYRPNETTGGIFVSWRRKEELPTGLD